jgi:hypothetical protein
VAAPDEAGVTMDANDLDWLTVGEVATALRSSPQTVRHRIRRGLLAAELHRDPRTGPTYRILRADVRAFGELHYWGKPRPAWLDEPD